MRNNSIKIRRFKKSDAEAVNKLLMRVFSRYNAEGVSQKGIKFFKEKYSKDNIRGVWGKGDYMLVAKDGNKIVGIGRAKKNGWITHVYVSGSHMGKSVGQTLMEKMESWLRRNNIKYAKLNSSLFALEFYKGLGYKKIMSGRKIYHGIPMYPMRKRLI